MSVEENRECIERHFQELWNEGRLDRVSEFFSSEFMNFGERFQDGLALIRHVVTVWRTAFPDMRFTTDLMITTGDVVVCEMTLQGTHLGEFQLIPPLSGPNLAPNGRTFKVKHMHRFVLRNAKIVEHFAVRDDLGMFHQLGNLAALAR